MKSVLDRAWLRPTTMDQLLWSASTAVLQGARRFAAAPSGPPAAELRVSCGAGAVRGGSDVCDFISTLRRP